MKQFPDEFTAVMKGIVSSLYALHFHDLPFIPISIGSDSNAFESDTLQGRYLPDERRIELSPKYFKPKADLENMVDTIKHEIVHAWLHYYGYPDRGNEHGEWFLWKANEVDVDVRYLLGDPKRAEIWEKIQRGWKPERPNSGITVVPKPSPPDITPALPPKPVTQPALPVRVQSIPVEESHFWFHFAYSAGGIFVFALILFLYAKSGSQYQPSGNVTVKERQTCVNNDPHIVRLCTDDSDKSPQKATVKSVKPIKPIKNQVSKAKTPNLDYKYFHSPQNSEDEIDGSDGYYTAPNVSRSTARDKDAVFGEPVDSPFGEPVDSVFGAEVKPRRRKR